MYLLEEMQNNAYYQTTKTLPNSKIEEEDSFSRSKHPTHLYTQFTNSNYHLSPLINTTVN